MKKSLYLLVALAMIATMLLAGLCRACCAARAATGRADRGAQGGCRTDRCPRAG